jgi:hypothetical protein
VRIEEQGRRLQKMFDDQLKAPKTSSSVRREEADED